MHPSDHRVKTIDCLPLHLQQQQISPPTTLHTNRLRQLCCIATQLHCNNKQTISTGLEELKQDKKERIEQKTTGRNSPQGDCGPPKFNL